MIKCVFHQEKLDPIDTVYEKHILSFSRPACRGILTWWNLKGLAELANLTVWELWYESQPCDKKEHHSESGRYKIDFLLFAGAN